MLAHIYYKNENKKLSKNLELGEVKCPCTWKECYFVLITDRNIKSFQKTRDDFGSAIFINSGHRCAKRNMLIGGVESSNHISGDALDLYPANGDFDGLYESAKKNYKFVYRGDNFIHCDNRLNKGELDD